MRFQCKLSFITYLLNEMKKLRRWNLEISSVTVEFTSLFCAFCDLVRFEISKRPTSFRPLTRETLFSTPSKFFANFTLHNRFILMWELDKQRQTREGKKINFCSLFFRLLSPSVRSTSDKFLCLCLVYLGWFGTSSLNSEEREWKQSRPNFRFQSGTPRSLSEGEFNPCNNIDERLEEIQSFQDDK